MSVDNLVWALRKQGKAEMAEMMAWRALKGREKSLGNEHPDTLVSVHSLAMVLREQRKYKAAEEMHQRALKGREKALGEEQPDTLNSVYSLAWTLGEQGKYEAAERMYIRAGGRFVTQLGLATSPYTSRGGHLFNSKTD
jgi:tetratricopeptide (TPR) repeat protein